MYNGFSKEGAIDEGSYVIGDWSEIVAVKSSTNYRIGNCPDGVLEMSREFYTHESTQFPRRVDFVACIRTGMKFGGKVEEIHRQNVSMLLGQTLAPSVNYIYIGPLQTSYCFTLRGKRVRPADGFAIEFCMWKVFVTSLFSLGGGDELQGSPFEAVALDDDDGDYGGSPGAPLGYIYVPTEGT